MVTGVTETRSTSPTSSFTNFRRYQEYDSDEEGESTPRSNEERLLNAIETIPNRIKSTTTNTKLLQTHVPNFTGQKDKFVEFEHFLLNHLSPLANKITEENKLHFFQSLLRDEATEYWQSIQITPLTTLKDVLDLFRKNSRKRIFKKWLVTSGIKPVTIPQQKHSAISSRIWKRPQNKLLGMKRIKSSKCSCSANFQSKYNKNLLWPTRRRVHQKKSRHTWWESINTNSMQRRLRQFNHSTQSPPLF